MAIRRVTGAVSPSELVFADANALGATYSGSGTTIPKETFRIGCVSSAEGVAVE